MIDFKGKILIIGCGFVSRCTIPLILKHIDLPAKNITVIDRVDNRKTIEDAIKKGIRYKIDTITKGNMKRILVKYVSKGDLIIDLAWNIDCVEILEWCHYNDVMYINTSVELWDPYSIKEYESPTARTLYERHLNIRRAISKWNNKNGATAVLEHGANPGLVSHFAKMGIEDIAKKIIEEKKNKKRSALLKSFLEKKDFATIAQLIGLKVIHISERDTQISNAPKQVNEFVNTWSVEGIYEEGIAPAEIGWGTHERKFPKGTQIHKYGPGNQICLSQMGVKTWVRSWVPSGEITGMVIRHGEAFTISDYLTVWKDEKPVYRPTVHYAYCPCDSTINSIHELEMRQYVLQKQQRILTDEIIDGSDELGVLLMGHDFKSWWVGSILDIHQSRTLVPHQNATTLQVACSVVAAVLWIIRNPNKGVCVPDDLPHNEVLSFAKQYLGTFVSVEVNWTPLMNRVNLFKGFNEFISDDDPWQFQSFLV